MAEFVKDLSLGWVLASGVADDNQRSNSVHFDQRRVDQGSGIIIPGEGANARFYAADGNFPISDIWELQVLDSGTLRVQTPYHMQAGKTRIFDETGTEVLSHQPSKFSRRDVSETAVALNGSGIYYMYQELKGRRSCEYRTLVQIDDSTLGDGAEDINLDDLRRAAEILSSQGNHFYRLALGGGEVLQIIDNDGVFNNFGEFDAATIAGGGEVAVTDPLGTAAYYYDNSGENSEKINWYYYAAPGAPFSPTPEYTYGEVTQHAWLVRADGPEGPYLTTYSKRQFDGFDGGSWYRSRWNWSLTPGYPVGEWILAYRGTEPDASVLPGVTRWPLYFDAFSSAGPQGDDEGVLYQVISTNSAAAAGDVSAAHAVVEIQRGVESEYFTFLRTVG